MPDTAKQIDVADDDVFYISLASQISAFAYELTISYPDGDGGWKPSVWLASGNSDHTGRIGTGAELRNSYVKISVGSASETAGPSTYPVDVKLAIMHTSGVLENIYSWHINPGIASGTMPYMTVKFN